MGAAIEADTGIRPPWAAESSGDLDGDVRQSIARVKASPSSRTPARSADSSSTSTPG